MCRQQALVIEGRGIGGTDSAITTGGSLCRCTPQVRDIQLLPHTLTTATGFGILTMAARNGYMGNASIVGTIRNNVYSSAKDIGSTVQYLSLCV